MQSPEDTSSDSFLVRQYNEIDNAYRRGMPADLYGVPRLDLTRTALGRVEDFLRQERQEAREQLADDYSAGAWQSEEAHNVLFEAEQPTILDIGCAFGQTLMAWRDKYPRGGKLLGIDINKHPIEQATKIANEKGKQNIEFKVGDACDIPLEDSSVDVTLALRMLYHVHDPLQALHEIARVTKPGGLVILSTTGENHKVRQRQFESLIAAKLGVSPPAKFANSFDQRVAKLFIPATFKLAPEPIGYSKDGYKVNEARLVVTKEDDSYVAYLDSLDSMRSAFEPDISGPEWDELWNHAVEEIVVRQVEAEIKRTATRNHPVGQFRDVIERYLWVCINSRGVEASQPTPREQAAGATAITGFGQSAVA